MPMLMRRRSIASPIRSRTSWRTGSSSAAWTSTFSASRNSALEQFVYVHGDLHRSGIRTVLAGAGCGGVIGPGPSTALDGRQVGRTPAT
jgi:hypothetical protein